MVQIARIRAGVLEDPEPAVGHLHGLCSRHVLAPSLKYPANPPSVGDPETIGVRTGAYFLLIAISVVASAFVLKARSYFRDTLGDWNAALLAVFLYVLVVS